jgi:hypothetical protein
MKTMRCVVVLLLLVGAGQLFQRSPVTGERTADQASELQSAIRLNMTKTRYFRTGQWRADARTLIAALDFLLRPETGRTNQISIPA